jgi:hypothetical protein
MVLAGIKVPDTILVRDAIDLSVHASVVQTPRKTAIIVLMHEQHQVCSDQDQDRP